jgi:hypothetical protein
MSKPRISGPECDPFEGLRNLGPATRLDLARVCIAHARQLASKDPDELYLLLQAKTGRRHDPCVRDVFAALIHQVRTGEARNWWTFSQERKLGHAGHRNS